MNLTEHELIAEATRTRMIADNLKEGYDTLYQNPEGEELTEQLKYICASVKTFASQGKNEMQLTGVSEKLKNILLQAGFSVGAWPNSDNCTVIW